jgi:putative MATE family efflux protein
MPPPPAAVAPAPAALAPHTRRLLEGPILPTLLRLAAPNIAVMALQSTIGIADAFFVASLGPEALAGVSLAFPMVMLMQMMSAGGMGGGVASAVARALGGGRRADANLLAVHAVAIAVVMAALFTVGVLAGGPALYRAMGGEGATLEVALAYSNVVFAGALVYWLSNTLGSIARGTGNMVLPAGIVVGTVALHLALSPSLILGLGPFPRLGVAGAGVAGVTAFTAATLVLLAYLLSGRSLVTLGPWPFRFRGSLLWEILRVGAPGSLNTVVANLTIVWLTGLVGNFGTYALAGYGMGARLEYLQIPLVFGLGSALVAMVGTSIGAGHVARAERVAWVGAALAGGLTGAIGIFAALFPLGWMGMFSREPAVLAAGSAYLRIVGPTYGFLGVGLALYFASQGAGRLMWPLFAGILRLVVATAGGWVAIHWFGGGLATLCAAMGAGLIAFGLTVVAAVRGGAWRASAPAHPAPLDDRRTG